MTKTELRREIRRARIELIRAYWRVAVAFLPVVPAWFRLQFAVARRACARLLFWMHTGEWLP